MILNRYIFKELLRSQLVVFAVLYTVFISQLLIRLISEASIGSIPGAIVAQLVLYALPEISVILLPLTVFIAILITLGRICSDSEMVVMRSVGFSPAKVMNIALIVAFITALITGVCSIYLIPKASQEQQKILSDAKSNPTFLPIESGRFVSFGVGMNIYIEEVEKEGGDNKKIRHIYVMQNPFSQINGSMTTASEGYLQKDESGVLWLYLKDGTRYEGQLADGTFRVGAFDTFRAPLSNDDRSEMRKLSISSMGTIDLLRSDNPEYNVEGQWRIAPIFTIFIICLIAVPLSMVNPRQGRFAKLMPAVLLFASYYMFLLSVRSLIMSGRFPMVPGIYVVPLAFFLLVAIPLNLPRHFFNRIMPSKSVKK